MSTHDFVDPVALFDARNSGRPTIPIPSDDPRLSEPRVYVSTGPTVLNPDGTIIMGGAHQSSYNAAQDIGDGSTGIIATARSQTGTPRAASEIRPHDLVRVDGVEIEAALAERMGYLRKTPWGTYEEVEGGPPKDDADKPKEAPQDAAEAFADGEAEGSLAVLCERTDPGLQVRALLQLTEQGEVARSTLETAANQLGIDPGEVSARLDGVVQAFEAQAVKAVQATGISDADAFFDWARQSHGTQLSAAMQQQGMERSTGATSRSPVNTSKGSPNGSLRQS